MKKLNHCVLVLMVLITHGAVWGQIYRPEFYPEDSSAAVYFHNRMDFESPLHLQPADSGLMDFESYNWLDRKMPFNASLGNAGLAYRNPDFSAERPLGFYYGINTFDAYIFQQEDLKYYLNHNPFSELGYITGASKEQLFHARHQQRVFKNLALGFDFDLINSLGTYQRQKSNNRRFAFKTQFFTDNLRYGIAANYSHSKIVVQESGGIAYDSVYELNLEPDRSIIAIKLSGAETRVRRAAIGLQQYFQMSGRKEYHSADSAYMPDDRFRLRLGRLSHSLTFERNALIYYDQNPKSGFYPNIYLDSVTTRDSVYIQNFENRFAWSNADYIDRIKPQPFVLLFGLKYRVSKVSDTLYSFTYAHLIPYGEVRFTPHPLLNIEGNAGMVISDDEYQGDFAINGLAQLVILRSRPYKTTFNFAIETQNLAPSFFYRHNFSNHFRWENDFNKTFSNKFSAYITQDKLKLGADLTAIDNYLYIAADTLPARSSSSVEVLKAYLEKDFKLGKFDLSGKLYYQKSSAEEVLRLPDFLAYLSLTFNMKLMKGALNTRTGFDLRYNTRYFADAYMPALHSFYLQNNKQIGNFVYADFFINFQVARTRFFLKAQNILSVFVREYDYYAVPHYPLQDFGLKFGLDWRFHD